MLVFLFSLVLFLFVWWEGGVGGYCVPLDLCSMCSVIIYEFVHVCVLTAVLGVQSLMIMLAGCNFFVKLIS